MADRAQGNGRQAGSAADRASRAGPGLSAAPKALCAAAALLALSACATGAKSRVQAGLTAFGVGGDAAGCMADTLDDRLATGQMDALADALDEASERMNARPARILDAARRLGDPQILRVATAAALGCGVLAIG